MSERNNPALRFLDEKLGPLIVRAMGFFTFKKALSSKVESVIFLKTAAIGDTVILSAIVKQVKQLRPDVKIYLAVGQSNTEIARLIPGVEVLSLKMTSPWAAIATLRSVKCDAIIDFDSWPRINAVLCFLSRTQFRLGFKTEGQQKHFAFHRYVEHQSDGHEVENYASLARILFPQLKNPYQPQLGLGASSPQSIAKSFVVHVSAGGKLAALKAWPNDHWISLITSLAQHGFLEVFFTGVESDRKKLLEMTEALKQSAPQLKVNLFLSKSLSELLVLLKAVDFVVTVDTGVAHLSGAIGQKTIVLYGPTHPKRWGALGDKVISILSPSPHAGQTSLGFDNSEAGENTMTQIEPAMVLQAVL